MITIYILYGGSTAGVVPYWKEVLGVYDSLEKLTLAKEQIQEEYNISNYFKDSFILLWSEEWKVNTLCNKFEEDITQRSWFGYG